MANEPIPVYVFTGFLESGKTKLHSGHSRGPEFYRERAHGAAAVRRRHRGIRREVLLHYGTALVPIESEDRLTPNILKRVEQKYQPDRILVEYNGMWKLEKLMQAFPAAGSCTRLSPRSMRPRLSCIPTTSAR